MRVNQESGACGQRELTRAGKGEGLTGRKAPIRGKIATTPKCLDWQIGGHGDVDKRASAGWPGWLALRPDRVRTGMSGTQGDGGARTEGQISVRDVYKRTEEWSHR